MLQNEIDNARAMVKIATVELSIASIIQVGDIFAGLPPEHQFWWKPKAQSEFIQSILLGLPMSAIVVAVDDEERWMLIDGLQRLRTILGFVCGGTRLTKTLLIPSLDGVGWDNLTAGQKALITSATFPVVKVKSQLSQNSIYRLLFGDPYYPY